MKVLFAGIAAIFVSSAIAQAPAVDERALTVNGLPAPFSRIVHFYSGFTAASWVPGPTGCSFRTANYDSLAPADWAITGGVNLPLGTEVADYFKRGDGSSLALFTVPAGANRDLRGYYVGPSGSLNSENPISVTVSGGKLRNALVSQYGYFTIAWLADSPTGDFVQIYRQTDLPNITRILPVEKSKKLQNYAIDKVGTPYVTTIAYDGTVNHRQLYSTGHARWHRSFPVETRVVVDTDGYTYTLRSTVDGIAVVRLDYNGNVDGQLLLPLSLGRRIDAFMIERNRYLMLVASKPTSTGRAATLVRINPAMDVRTLALEGALDAIIIPSIAADRSQTYVCSTTAGQAPEELVQAVDTRYMVTRWLDRRLLGENEDPSQILASPYGLMTTNNRNGQGISRKFIDYGFQGFYPTVVYAKGGGTKSLGFDWYVGRPEEHTLYFTSSDPVNCKVPESFTLSVFRNWTITAELAPVTQRTQYRVYAYDPWTSTTRTVVLVVDP